MGFRVRWAVFRFAKPRIPDSTNKTDFPDSRVRIPLHGTIKEVIAGEKLQMAYCDERNKMDGNLPKHNLQTWPYLLGWLLHKSFIECFWHVRRQCPLPLSRPQASRPISMLICIFNHKRDLFFSVRKHSAFFAATTVAQCFKKKFCAV